MSKELFNEEILVIKKKHVYLQHIHITEKTNEGTKVPSFCTHD